MATDSVHPFKLAHLPDKPAGVEQVMAHPLARSNSFTCRMNRQGSNGHKDVGNSKHGAGGEQERVRGSGG